MTENNAIISQDDTTLMVRDKETALAANPQLAAQTSAIEVLKQRAMILLDSGMLPDSIRKWQQAAAIMMRAEDLEVDYWTGLMHLPAIKGMPQPDGQLCMALIQRSELMERYEILASTDQVCTIRMKRIGQPAFDITCTFQEYEKVAGPDSKRQPKTHLFWYTYKQGARRLFSDVLNNMQPKSSGRRVIIEDDLVTDLPDDDVYVIEEGEDQPTATVPLSAAPRAENVSSASANKDDASDESRPIFGQNPQGAEVLISADGQILARGDVSGDGGLAIEQVYERFEVGPTPQLGSLDMKSLQERALRAGLVDNEFHFANLLKQMLADGTIRENWTVGGVLDAMLKHKAEKEFAEASRKSAALDDTNPLDWSEDETA